MEPSQSQPTWGKDIGRLTEIVEAALETARKLYPVILNTMADDVLPHEPPEPGASLLDTLRHELEQTRQKLSELCERMVTGPSTKFITGALLSSDEYYALAAAGDIWPNRSELLPDCLGNLSDYELYRLFHCEDDTWQGVINPSLQPRDATPDRVGMRFGRCPEDIPRARLRPDQLSFFAKQFPDVFARFG